MPLHDERTVTFNIWPIMLLLDGPPTAIGTLIGMMYRDQAVARDSWTVSHRESSRLAYAETLKADGSDRKRQGVGVREDGVAVTIENRARALGLKCLRFASTTTGSA